MSDSHYVSFFRTLQIHELYLITFLFHFFHVFWISHWNCNIWMKHADKRERGFRYSNLARACISE